MDFLVRILFKDEGFAAGLKRATTKLNNAFTRDLTPNVRQFLGGQLAQVASATAILAATRGTLQWANAMTTLADRTGLTVEELQKLQYAAETNNASLQDFISALRYLTIQQMEAVSGKGRSFDAFATFGIGLKEIQSQSPYQLLLRISQGMQQTGLSTRGVAAAIQLMGRQSDVFFPAMLTGLDQLGEAAKKANAVMSEIDVRELSALQEEIVTNWQTIRAVFGHALAFLARGLDGLFVLLRLGARGFAEAAAKLFGFGHKAAEWQAEDTKIWNEMLDRHDPQKLLARRGKGMATDAAVAAAEKAQREREEAERKKAERQQVEAQKSGAAFLSGAGAPPAADALTRLGLFVGGASPTVRALQQQSRELRSILEEMRRLNRNVTAE